MSKERCSQLQGFWVRKSIVSESVTRQEIAKFWRQKLIEEQDHLLDAIKAAARIRARNLSDNGYKLFEDSLKDDDGTEENNTTTTIKSTLGIKDWWTRSKYAYLNQPTIEAVDPPKRQSYCYLTKNFSFNPTIPVGLSFAPLD